MYVHINDLPFELLNNILDLLPLKELFHIERVCKKWQEVVKKLLDQKETLHPLDESLKRKYQTGLLGGMIFNDDYIDILKKILPKCQNIKELDLSYIKVNENNLIEIAKLCPKLKSISLLQTQFYVSEDEMNEFGKLIGPQLIKCKFNYFFGDHFDALFNALLNDDRYTKLTMTKYLKFNIILIKHLKNVEEIFFNTKKFQMTKMLFHYLNAGCQNLKALHWMPDWLENINYQNQDLINVMQRVHFLEIGLTQLTEFQFDPNNLTQLTLNHYDDYKIEKIKITFPNVTKLNIYSFHDEEYDSISEYKFPKLEFAKVIERNDEERMMIKEPFVHQIKYIKTLEYKTEFEVWIPFFISQLSQLTNLVWKQEIKRHNSIAEFFECLDVFSEHQLLENIKIEIQDEHWLIHKDFYEKLICFYKTKPNTKIVIRVSKVKKYVEQEDDEDKNEDEDEDGEGENDDDDEDEDDEDEDDEDEDDEDEDDEDEDEDKMNQDEEVNDLDEYIKLFKETKDMHKLNMKLFII